METRLLDARFELNALLRAARVDLTSFQQELQLRGHNVHISTLAKYINPADPAAAKEPPDWMLVAARHTAAEAGTPGEEINGGDALHRPAAPLAEKGNGPHAANRSVTCALPLEIFDAIENARASDPAVPSRSEMVRLLIKEGLASLTRQAARHRKRYACVVCGKISSGHLPPEGFDRVGEAKRLPTRHHGKDGQPCAGNYRYAELVREAGSLSTA